MNSEENTDLKDQDNSTEVDSPVSEDDIQQATPNSDSEADVNSAESFDLEGELASAQEEIAKLKDAFLRAKAEEDNVRRRAEKEVANSRKFAVEGFAKEMLNVYDSLKLAVNVEVSEQAEDSVKSIHEGVGITLKQLESAFIKYSVKAIQPEVGDKLDPNLHQAMSMIDSEDIASGCIITVIQAGFELQERLLRPAMVVVAK